MSLINELIEKLCPNGVEWKSFFDVCDYIRGITYNKHDEILNDTSGIKVLRANNITLETNTLNYDDVKIVKPSVKTKSSQWLKKGDILICAGSGSKEHIGKVAFIREDIDYVFGGFMGVIRPKTNNYNQSFLFYILSSDLFKNHLAKTSGAASATINNINNDTWSDFQIPLPPLEIQKRIVEILDHFTNLTANLTAELNLRRKQFEHYREKLFTFGEDVEWMKIGNITRVFSASRVHKNEWKTSGVPFFRSSDVMSAFNGVENNHGKAFISYELYEQLSKKSGVIHKGDLLITGGGSIGIPYIVPFEPIYVKDADLICVVQNSKLNNRFLYHYLLTNTFRDYLSDITHNAVIAHYTISQISNTVVPVPSIEVQQSIVEKLDKFTALIENIEQEIALRQKQYEYYREKLLTF